MTGFEEEAEVTVIGGGGLGCLATYYLAKEGADVVLVERGDIASGAIGSSNGWVFVEEAYGPTFERLTRINTRMCYDLDDSLKEALEFRVSNHLLCYTDEDVGRMRKLKSWRNWERKLIRRSDLGEPEPNLAEDIAWVTVSPLAYVQPHRLCLIFSNLAKKHGARVLTHTRVTEIAKNGNKVSQVQTDRGRINTKFVVNAAGAWAPIIGRMVGIDIPVIPVFGQSMVTEPSPPFIRNYYTIGGAGWSRALYPEKANGWEFTKYGVFEGTITEYWPQENAYIISGCRLPVSEPRDPPPVIPGIIRFAAEHAARFIPKLSRLNIIRVFSSYRPKIPDGKPIIGKVEGLDGFIVATGTDGGGVASSMIIGKIISELILENKTSTPIEDLSYSRFNSANLVQAPSTLAPISAYFGP